MTLIILPNSRNCGTAARIVAESLNKGKICVIPTETSYGIAVLAENAASVRKLREIKGRSTKEISVLVDCLGSAGKYCYITRGVKRLVRKFMPGPLTLVVRKRKGVLRELRGKGLAFRISSNKFAFLVCKKLGKAITATSANLSMEKPIYSGKEIVEKFSGKVDVIVNAGDLKRREVSTVFDVRAKKILRKGPISERKILKVLGK